MKVRYREGLAIHPDPSEGVVAEEGLTTPPESCLPVPQCGRQALVSVRTRAKR